MQQVINTTKLLKHAKLLQITNTNVLFVQRTLLFCNDMRMFQFLFL